MTVYTPTRDVNKHYSYEEEGNESYEDMKFDGRKDRHSKVIQQTAHRTTDVDTIYEERLKLPRPNFVQECSHKQ